MRFILETVKTTTPALTNMMKLFAITIVPTASLQLRADESSQHNSGNDGPRLNSTKKKSKGCPENEF